MSYQRRLTMGCFLSLILLLTTQCGQTAAPPPAAAPTDAVAAVPTDAPAPTEAPVPTEAPTEEPTEEATEAATEEATEEATEAPDMEETATEGTDEEETATAETDATMAAGETETAAGAGAGVATGPTTVPELSWQGTITFFSQAYTPNSTQENADQLVAFQAIADEYQKLHPGITIEFIDEDIPELDTVLRTKAAAGEVWDIFWAQWGNLNGNLPEGIAVDLTPHLDEPNHYIPGNQRWRDAMNQTVLGETISPKGAMYNINGDFVGTAFYYNKDLFEQAGISAPPKTWPELIQVAQKLKDAGITPMSQDPSYGWFQRHFLTDFYSKDFDTIQNFDGAPAISPLDEAVAMQKGLLSTKDPRFMAWWPVYKQLTDTWSPDYLTMTGAEADDQPLQDFTGGRTAMFYSGSWTGNNIRTAGATFNWGTFNFPKLSTADSEYATGISTAGQVGGPNAAYQYAISTPKANKTMEEAGKPEAVLDFLRFIGTPRVVEEVVNEKGAFIPTWPGTTPSAGNEVIIEQAEEGLKSVWVGNSTPDLEPSIQRTFGLYLSGNIELEEATTQVQEALDKAVVDYAKTNNVDYSTYE